MNALSASHRMTVETRGSVASAVLADEQGHAVRTRTVRVPLGRRHPAQRGDRFRIAEERDRQLDGNLDGAVRRQKSAPILDQPGEHARGPRGTGIALILDHLAPITGSNARGGAAERERARVPASRRQGARPRAPFHAALKARYFVLGVPRWPLR